MSGVAFPTTDAVDFLVLGAGAAGGVVAKELATAGFPGGRAGARPLPARERLFAR